MNDLMKEILKLEDAWDFLYFYTITYSRILMNEILKLEDTIFYTCYNLFTKMDEILKLKDARYFLYLLQTIHEFS